MSLLIGTKTENGKIRYISVANEYKQSLDRVAGLLRNFYQSPERVQALIDLGNLYWLGASPYKKSKGNNDNLNCESYIRDRKLSPGKHGTSLVENEAEFVKKLEHDSYGLNCCFLFENNEWYILVGSHRENIRSIDSSVLKKSTRMDGLKVYRYNPEENYNRFAEKEFYTWEEVRESADKDSITYYIFRGEKLLTIIHPQEVKTA